MLHTQVLLAMLTRMVQQEMGEGSELPATDHLLRARPEATSVEFMLWVAEQESQAPTGRNKEVRHADTSVSRAMDSLKLLACSRLRGCIRTPMPYFQQ